MSDQTPREKLAEQFPVYPDPLGRMLLYDGGFRIRDGAVTADGSGQIWFDLEPSPAVRFVQRRDEFVPGFTHGSRLQFPVELTGPLRSASLIEEAPGDDPIPGQVSKTTGYVESVLGLAASTTRSFDSVETFVINLRHRAPVKIAGRGAIVIEAAGWRVSLWENQPRQEVAGRLADSRGYAVTHTARFRRTDGGPFNLETFEAFLEPLLRVIAFTQGGLVGIALPTAFDPTREPVWASWMVTKASRWAEPNTWCDQVHGVTELGQIAERWIGLEQSSDRWSSILQRLVGLRADSRSDADSHIDSRVVLAAAALDLLVWAIHHNVEPLTLPADTMKFAKLPFHERVRRALDRAHIPTSIPAEYAAISAWAKPMLSSNDPNDGVQAAALTRNKVVHPNRKGDVAWPSGQVLLEALRLTYEYTDLLLLQLLGYAGSYGSQLLFGRMSGDVRPVPWAEMAE